MENRSEPREIIDERTVETILERLAAISGKIPVSIDRKKIPGFIERLQRFELFAYILYVLTPSPLRSSFDRTAQGLLNDLQSLLKRLNDFQHPLNIAAEDVYQHACSQSVPGATPPEYVQLNKILNEIPRIILLIHHLQQKSVFLAGMDEQSRMEWIMYAKPEQLYVRHELHSLLVKPGKLKADIDLVVALAELYSYLFDNPFSVSTLRSIDGRTRDKNKPQYKGPSIRFACAVLQVLQLSRLIVPRPITRNALANRIGHIWKNHRKRLSRRPRKDIGDRPSNPPLNQKH